MSVYVCINEMVWFVHYIFETTANAHVEDLELSGHEACSNEHEHGHSHSDSHSDHECSADKKISGTPNKILQGEITPIMCICLFI